MDLYVCSQWGSFNTLITDQCFISYTTLYTKQRNLDKLTIKLPTYPVLAMASYSFKLIYLFILVSFFSFATTKAQDGNQDSKSFVAQNCTGSKTTANSTYQAHLKTLFSSLSSNSTTNKFYNTTIISGRNPSSDTVYGLFMCRGDILCRSCVINATQKLSSDSECSLSKQAVIWYQECMVRYSDNFFFSTVDTNPRYEFFNNMPAPSDRFLIDTMTQVAYRAASSPFGDRYATMNVSLAFQFIYTLAQCTQDLSPQGCIKCLTSAIDEIPQNGAGQGGRVLFPSCIIRYELFPFFYIVPDPIVAPQGLVPETNYQQKDSNYSQDPGYLSHDCSNTTTVLDGAFRSNLTAILSYLSSNATTKKFHKTNISGTIYGLFMCRGDIPSRLCGQCVLNATQVIAASNCSSSKEAIIWYNHCFLRYSNQSFNDNNVEETSPRFEMLNITNNRSNVLNRNYTLISANALAQVAKQAAESTGEIRYGTNSSRLNDEQTLYMLAQCTPDMSNTDCGGCLTDVIGSTIPWSRLGSIGGRVLYPSCNLRFELFPFYNLEAPKAPTSPPPETRKSPTLVIILIVVSTAVVAILSSFGYYLRRRKSRKAFKAAFLRENFGHESAALEPLRFDWAIIEAATNNFSHENKIGKGGFGEVYKGILIDGSQIAVKRLSRTSRQGAEEFKNEVPLIAKLQHRNLMALRGFCIDNQEKILIYEYVPNKSLDYFLFDSQQQRLLSWYERYNIIGGIARGILYLHEYSRLKVIHRDLKPSNILLDENMDPKISDFGLARIVEIDRDEENTKKIVGTYGYMSPEYAILGQFSEKSDVFSFGVMVLEIITGKKNVGSSETFRIIDGLLGYAWRQWRDQTPLDILDPRLGDNYTKNEVIKCIQIGLLCVQGNPYARPSMMSVVSYLSSHLIKLPSPQEPAFFLNGRVVAYESSSSQSTNRSIPYPVNEMSISDFPPRQ